MSVNIPTRQQLWHAIDELPTEALPELTSFLDYLRFKVGLSPLVEQTESTAASTDSSAFLMSLVGIGTCDETDLSIRDEEILAAEIDPIRGWGLQEKDTP
jgi:hypothetical protein